MLFNHFKLWFLRNITNQSRNIVICIHVPPTLYLNFNLEIKSRVGRLDDYDELMIHKTCPVVKKWFTKNDFVSINFSCQQIGYHLLHSFTKLMHLCGMTQSYLELRCCQQLQMLNIFDLNMNDLISHSLRWALFLLETLKNTQLFANDYGTVAQN